MVQGVLNRRPIGLGENRQLNNLNLNLDVITGVLKIIHWKINKHRARIIKNN